MTASDCCDTAAPSCPEELMICAKCAAQTDEKTCPTCGEDAFLAGRYRLDFILGQSAGGITYKGIRADDARDVVVQALPVSSLRQEESRNQLRRNARALASVHHPQLSRHIEAFEAPVGRLNGLFWVGSYIDGVTLSSLMEQGPMDEAEVVELMTDLLRPLQYLREANIAHGSIQPDSIIATPQGQYALVDLYRARGAFKAGHIQYPPTWTSPELLHSGTPPTPADDLYGLGMSALAMLLGRVPVDCLDDHGDLVVPDLQVRPTFRALIEGMVHPDPKQRIRDIGAVRVLLQAIDMPDEMATEEVQTPPPAPHRSPAPRRVPPPIHHTPLPPPPKVVPPLTEPLKDGDSVIPPVTRTKGPSTRDWVMGLGIVLFFVFLLVVIAVLSYLVFVA